MLDCLIKNGTVVDGTGAPARVADVGVRGGRIVAVGQLDEAAQQTVDATGLWITPGFVDIHEVRAVAAVQGIGRRFARNRVRAQAADEQPGPVGEGDLSGGGSQAGYAWRGGA